MLRLGLLVIVSLASIWFGLAFTAAQESEGLEFVQESGLTVVFPYGSSEQTTMVTVANESDSPIEASFCVVSGSQDGSCESSDLTVSVNEDPQVPANRTKTMTVTITNKDGSAIEPFSGYLVITSPVPGDVTALGISFDQSQFSLLNQLFTWLGKNRLAEAIMVVSASLALLLVIVHGIFKRPKGGWQPPERINPSFKFSESWAASLTTVAAALGVVITAGLLPENTRYISKNTLVGINLIFGLLMVIAPIFYNATRERRQVNPPLYEGWMLAYWVAYGLVLWAILGEVLASLVLIEEMFQQDILPFIVLRVFGLLVLVIGLGAVYYAFGQTEIVAEESQAITSRR